MEMQETLRPEVRVRAAHGESEVPMCKLFVSYAVFGKHL